MKPESCKNTSSLIDLSNRKPKPKPAKPAWLASDFIDCFEI